MYPKSTRKVARPLWSEVVRKNLGKTPKKVSREIVKKTVVVGKKKSEKTKGKTPAKARKMQEATKRSKWDASPLSLIRNATSPASLKSSRPVAHIRALRCSDRSFFMPSGIACCSFLCILPCLS